MQTNDSKTSQTKGVVLFCSNQFHITLNLKILRNLKSNTSATSSPSQKAIFDLPGALFHNEPSYKTFYVEISLIYVKMDLKAAHIFVCMVSREDSF